MQGVYMSTKIKNRIAYVIKMYPRFSETFIVNEILSHEAAGVEVEIFSLRKPVDGRFHDIVSKVNATVTYIPEESLSGEKLWRLICDSSTYHPDFWETLQIAKNYSAKEVGQSLLLSKIVRERKITHLHAHFASTATTVARLAALFLGISYTFTTHAKDIFHHDVIEEDFSDKLDNSHAAITISDFNYSYIKQCYGDKAARLKRVYNGLSLDKFIYINPRERPRVIVSVGRLVAKKGISVLIDACFVLRQKKIIFQCFIIGDGPLKEELQEQIESYNLSKFVTLTGAKTQRKVKHLVQNASVFAAPCIVANDGNRDGLPTVLLEAMALGTPCVSTNVTGIPEVVQNNSTGILVNEKNSSQLAEALEKLLSNSELRVMLSKNARKRIEDDFDIDKNTKILRHLIFDKFQSEIKPVHKRLKTQEYENMLHENTLYLP